MPHPIRWIGHACAFWEKRLYRPTVGAGVLFWACVVGTVLAAVLAVLAMAYAVSPWLGGLVQIYLVWACLATRSLHKESQPVESALEAGELETARSRVAMIVGRETTRLSPAEIRRAVIETVAENLSDGVVAPIFYGLLLGVPGMLLYKAVNTMDSMVGYKNDRHLLFGRFAARADDVLNFIPARLTALLIVLVARPLGLNAAGARRILRRDRDKASSPNAGWPEAAMAGALDVQLGGANWYFGKLVEKPLIGDPGHPLTAADYRNAVRLLYAVSAAGAAVTLVLLSVGFWM
jgi:adenosylcobinamide-phosphate synthase